MRFITDIIEDANTFIIDLDDATQLLNYYIEQGQNIDPAFTQRCIKLINDSAIYYPNLPQGEAAAYMPKYNSALNNLTILLLRIGQHEALHSDALNKLLTMTYFPVHTMEPRLVKVLNQRIGALLRHIGLPSPATTQTIVDRYRSSPPESVLHIGSQYLYKHLLLHSLHRLTAFNPTTPHADVTNTLACLNRLSVHHSFLVIALIYQTEYAHQYLINPQLMLELFIHHQPGDNFFATAVQLWQLSQDAESYQRYQLMQEVLVNPIALFETETYQTLLSIIPNTKLFDLSVACLGQLTIEKLHELNDINLRASNENMFWFYNMLLILKQSNNAFDFNHSIRMMTRSNLFRLVSSIYATNHFNGRQDLTAPFIAELQRSFSAISIEEAVVYARTAIVQQHPAQIIELAYTALNSLLATQSPIEIAAYIYHLQTAGVSQDFLQASYDILQLKIQQIITVAGDPTNLDTLIQLYKIVSKLANNDALLSAITMQYQTAVANATLATLQAQNLTDFSGALPLQHLITLAIEAQKYTATYVNDSDGSSDSGVVAMTDIRSGDTDIRAELEAFGNLAPYHHAVITFKSSRNNMTFGSVKEALEKHDTLLPYLRVKPSHIIASNLRKHGMTAPQGLLPNGLFICNTTQHDLVIDNGIIFFMGRKTHLTDEMVHNPSLSPHVKPCGNHYSITRTMPIIFHDQGTEIGAYEANHIRDNDIVSGTLEARSSARGDVLCEFEVLALPEYLVIPPGCQYEVAWNYHEPPGGSNGLTAEMLSASAKEINLITQIDDQPAPSSTTAISDIFAPPSPKKAASAQSYTRCSFHFE